MKKDKMAVYVTQLPSKMSPEGYGWVPTVDLTAAKLYGELRFLFSPGINVQDMPAAAEAMRVGLEAFDPEVDYFLPLADPTLMVLGAAQLGARFQKFNMLKWDRHARKYFSHTIETQKGKLQP